MYPPFLNYPMHSKQIDSCEKETLALSTVSNFPFTTTNAGYREPGHAPGQSTGTRTPQTPNTSSIKSLPALITSPHVPPAPSFGMPG
ncbi:hypothetical protein AVEN_84270-1 [Araneus ventricosus]|uniref:Uncharacterized protein n=1 Tax=Araneus ventricosus TaxID=182803 RepID=A0A4Y2JND4_ARAVE|nr:hypothetical protein AVEN_84270-1 [Araneus ventricosus]